MHPEAYSYVQKIITSLPESKFENVLDMGGRDVNGTVRNLLPQDAIYTSIDIRKGSNVTVVADAALYGRGDTYSLVLCTEVLEHAYRAAEICANAHRILETGGVFIVTTAYLGRPAHSAVDGGPLRDNEHYCNISKPLMQYYLRHFRSVEIEVNGKAHDIYAVAIK